MTAKRLDYMIKTYIQ